MIEAVKHAFGFCGEGHPHLLNLSPFLLGIAGYLYYIKEKIKLWKNKNRT
jgi:hypothetical protein